MTTRIIYMVVGIGVKNAGDRGVMCQTWPDCDAGFPGTDSQNPSTFDTKGYDTIQGQGTYTAMGGTVFSTEYQARGWLEFDDAGKKFLAAYQNVVIVRSLAEY
jgi:hypothetical protein